VSIARFGALGGGGVRAAGETANGRQVARMSAAIFEATLFRPERRFAATKVVTPAPSD
jgi:hypothetical protein